MTTHPIQYQVPWFRAMTDAVGLELHVGFAWLPDHTAQGHGFGVPFAWDVPLLDGYRWTELDRSGREPALGTFLGLRLRDVKSWLRQTDVAALIVTGWNSLSLVQAALAARTLGRPVLVRGDSHDLRPRAAWKQTLQRQLLRLFDAHLAVGEANRRYYLRRGVPQQRIFPCPHFVDNERLARQHAAALPRRTDLRRDWGIPENAVCAVFAGKLIPEKNLHEALAALPLAAGRAPRLHLLVVGDGPLLGELKSVARSGQLPVSFTGFLNQSQIPGAYAASDLLLLPSRSETWGLVVNEAMACGLPAVVSDQVGCAEDLVVQDVTGLTYPSGDAAALAQCLVALAGEPERRTALGAAARERVESGYSVEAAVDGTLAALRYLGALE